MVGEVDHEYSAMVVRWGWWVWWGFGVYPPVLYIIMYITIKSSFCLPKMEAEKCLVNFMVYTVLLQSSNVNFWMFSRTLASFDKWGSQTWGLRSIYSSGGACSIGLLHTQWDGLACANHNINTERPWRRPYGGQSHVLLLEELIESHLEAPFSEEADTALWRWLGSFAFSSAAAAASSCRWWLWELFLVLYIIWLVLTSSGYVYKMKFLFSDPFWCLIMTRCQIYQDMMVKPWGPFQCAKYSMRCGEGPMRWRWRWDFEKTVSR